METKIANIADVTLGGDRPLILIAGPCVIEDGDMTMQIAQQLQIICRAVRTPLIFKASFDKANRTSISSFRGVGIGHGLDVLSKIKDAIGCPVTTDIHESHQADQVGEVCDLIQIPAFLARQTDLLVAAAQTGRAVNVKKGQFMSPADMRFVVEKLRDSGCENILLTERGTFFGYGNLVNDFASLHTMRTLGVPVVFDATHSVQQRGSNADVTGGNRQLVAPLARAAAAVGVDALFIETHPNPDASPSDAANIYPLDRVEHLLSTLIQIHRIAREADLQKSLANSK